MTKEQAERACKVVQSFNPDAWVDRYFPAKSESNYGIRVPQHSKWATDLEDMDFLVWLYVRNGKVWWTEVE